MTKQTTFYLILCFFLFITTNIFSQAPVITKQPVNEGVIEGQTATFVVEATGNSLTFQWYKDGVLVGGATDSIYTTPATNVTDNGSLFSVKVENTSGDDSSTAATLYVTAVDQRVTQGELVLYNFKEGNGNTIHDVSGVGNPLNLTINKPSNVDWSAAGLQIKDTALISSPQADKIIDSVSLTNEITVELWLRPLTKNQNNLVFSLNYGSNEIDFSVETFSPYGYNWLVRSTSTSNYGIPGLLDTTGVNTKPLHLVLTRSADSVLKIYKDGIEVASKHHGGVFSNWNNQSLLNLASFISGDKPWKGIFYSAAVYKRALDSTEIAHNYSIGASLDHAPFIIEQPQNIKSLAGYSVTFKIQAIGDPVLSYQWQKNGTNITGATDSEYTTPPTTLADSGNTYRVIVTNSSGSDTSNNAVLSVIGVSPDCPDGISHYYHLTESAAPYKDTVGFSNGISSKFPTSIDGIVGTAQNFLNQEKIDIPSDNTFNWKSDESFSIEFWMRTSNVPVANRVIIGRVDASSGLGWWVGITPNGKAAFQLTSSGGTGVTIGDKGLSINDGTWHLIVATRNGSNNMNYLYIDSSKVDSASQSYLTGFNGTTPITLGYLNVSPFYYYDGSLDEVALYSVALSKSDIQTHYQKGKKGLGYCEAFPTIKAPSSLKAIKDNVDTTNIKLSWTDNSSNELGFVLQRKLGDSASVAAYSTIDTVASDITAYIDTTTIDTTKYTYRIYAYNNDTVSAYSNVATFTTPLPVELTSFTVNTVDGKVLIAWETATEINNAGFSIERSADNKKFAEVSFH